MDERFKCTYEKASLGRYEVEDEPIAENEVVFLRDVGARNLLGAVALFLHQHVNSAVRRDMVDGVTHHLSQREISKQSRVLWRVMSEEARHRPAVKRREDKNRLKK